MQSEKAAVAESLDTIGVPYRATEKERVLRIPRRFLRVAGIKRNANEETFYAREFPLEEFFKAHPAIRAYRTMVRAPLFKGELKGKVARLKRMFPYSHLRKPKRAPEPGRDPTDDIRAKAFSLGYHAIGFTRYDWRYTYANERNRIHFSNAIALALALDYDAGQQAPSVAHRDAIAECLAGWAERAAELAEYIRSIGYRAQVTEQDRVLVQPYALQAGLGQMGANGQLLIPAIGSRMRLGLIFTDAPVRLDEPIDLGIPRLCSECQICVNRCPGRALIGQEVNWRGVTKYKTIASRCLPMFERFDSCSACMRVCPVQKYGLEAVMEHYTRTGGEILGKGTDELEGYDLPGFQHFGPQELPLFTLEEATLPVLETPRPLHRSVGAGRVAVRRDR